MARASFGWDAERALGGGLIAGLVAGVLLSIGMLIMTASAGGDIWTAMKGAGTPFLGERAQQPGFDALAVTVGVACHLGISMIWGVLFGALFYGIGRPATVFMGASWGVVVWLVMYYVVLPVVGLGAITEKTPIAQAILSHVAFGVAVALAFLPFQRRIYRPITTTWPRADRPVSP